MTALEKPNVNTTKPADDKPKKGSRILRIFLGILIFLLSVGAWLATAYYGYTYAKDYIDTSIKNVRQENAVNMHQLSERIDLLTKEIANLKEAIEETDSSLSYSTRVQKRIDRELEELDERLEDLKESLEILKEAPDVKDNNTD